MMRLHGMFGSARRRGAAILEYVIIAVGIAIFCTFGILMFGKAAQSQMDAATSVMSGEVEADDASVHDAAKTNAGESEGDLDRAARMDRGGGGGGGGGGG